MTTKKNLVKQVLMSTLTAGIFATAFTACNDEDIESQGFNNGPKAESFELTNLEQYSYTVPVQVNIAGDWEIDFKFNNENNHFCYALPSKGHGPQTIKLCMLDNWTENRNEGQMIIRDLGNNNNDQSFRLMQKCNLDNNQIMSFRTRTRGNAGEEAKEGEAKEGETKEEKKAPEMYNKGRRAMAVGYGYKATDVPGPSAVSLNPIIALDLLAQAGDDAGPKTMNCESQSRVKTFEASTYEELFQNVIVEANGKATKGGLTAEMKDTYEHDQKTATDLMYVYTTVDVNLTNAYLSGITKNNIRQYLTDNAKAAIDGEGKYATGDEGFLNLLNDFGSHLIMKSDLGGRLRYATTVKKSLTQRKDSASAYAKCSYKNKIVSEASASVSASIASNYKNHTKDVTTVVKAQGGTITMVSKSEDVDKWVESIHENLMCVGVGNNEKDLIPLYDLVDTSTDEGVRRYEAMKQYFDSGLAQVMAYDGTDMAQTEDVYHFSISSDLQTADGYKSEHEGTLVYEAWFNGKPVAMICKEYMPQISNQGLVLTVYPVIDNKPDFMNGRFLGNDLLEPHKIMWNKNHSGKAIMTKDGKDNVMETEIYVRGGQIITYKPISCKRLREAEVKGMYLEGGEKAKSDCSVTFGITGDGREWNSELFNYSHVYKNPWLEGLKYDKNYKYPLVKFGTSIWTRENYNGNAPHGGKKEERFGTKIEKGEVFFTYKSLANATFPDGWHAGKTAEYQELKSVILSDGQTSQVGERMKEKGASGFNLKYTGWYTYTECFDDNFIFSQHWYYNYKRCGNGTQAEYLLPGKGHIRIRSNKFDICANEKPNKELDSTGTNKEEFAMQIRLVMDM